MKAKYIFGFIGGKVRLAQSLAPDPETEPSEDKCTDGGPHVWATYVSVHKTPWELGDGKCLECVKCKKTTNHTFQVLNTSPGAAVDLNVCQQCTACGMPVVHAWKVGANGYDAPDGRGHIAVSPQDGTCLICQGRCTHPEGFAYSTKRHIASTDEVPHPGVQYVETSIAKDAQDHAVKPIYSTDFHFCPICGGKDPHVWIRKTFGDPGEYYTRFVCKVCGQIESSITH